MNILDYAPPAPRRQRVVAWLRSRPWPSRRTLLALLVFAGCALLLWSAFEPWQLERMFAAGWSTLPEKVSPDGTRLLAGRRRGMVGPVGNPVVYHLHSGEALFEIAAGTDVEWVSFSPDGRRIIGTDRKSIVHLWDAADGRHITQIQLQTRYRAGARQAFFSPDGRRVLIVESIHATLYDATTGEKVATLEQPGMDRHIGEYAFSPDGRLVSIAVLNATELRICATEDGREVDRIPIIFGQSIRQAYSSDSSRIVLHNGTQLECWLLARGAALWVQPLRGNLSELRFSPNDQTILTLSSWSGRPATLTAFDAATGGQIATLPTPAGAQTLHVSPDGRTLLAGWVHGPGTIAIDLATMKQIGSANRAPRFADPWSPDGRLIALRPAKWPIEGIEIYEHGLARMHSIVRLSDRMNGQLHDTCFVGDSRHLLTATDVGAVHLWRLRRPPQLWGVVALWQFWLALVALLLLAASYGRDLLIWAR